MAAANDVVAEEDTWLLHKGQLLQLRWLLLERLILQRRTKERIGKERMVVTL